MSSNKNGVLAAHGMLLALCALAVTLVLGVGRTAIADDLSVVSDAPTPEASATPSDANAEEKDESQEEAQEPVVQCVPASNESGDADAAGEQQDSSTTQGAQRGVTYVDENGVTATACCKPLSDGLAAGVLAGGKYVVDGELTMTGTVEVTADTKIFLEDKPLTVLCEGKFHVPAGVTLKIYAAESAGSAGHIVSQDADVCVACEGTVLIYRCDVTGSGRYGVEAREGGDVTLNGCAVSGFGECGVASRADAVVHLIDTAVTGNGGYGVAGPGRVTVAGNIAIKDNGKGNLVLEGTPLAIEAPLADDARIGVTWCEGDGIFTEGYAKHYGEKDPAKLFFADESYSIEMWDGEARLFDVIPYVDEKGETATISTTACTDLAKSKTKNVTLTSGWYYVSKSTQIKNRGRIKGDVKLILCDGAKLDWQGGIRVDEGNKFTIYGQEEGTGELVADHGSSSNGDAGIGGNSKHTNGDITICGGHVTARGGEDAAGIGGGYNSGTDDCGAITIYGGDIEAYGKEFGAGIGGGNCGEGNRITIYGGKVFAKGGDYNLFGSGAGIGGGNAAAGHDIKILGGEVTARGRDYSAAIGGGNLGDGYDITIENAVVDASSPEYGAAIGGGCGADAGRIVIRNAHVRAIADEGAGIGAGDGETSHPGGDGGDVIIEGNSVVEAKSSDGGCAIGHSDDTRRSRGTVALDDCLHVINLDKGKDAVVAADKREHTCLHADHAKIEPCGHKDTYYERTDETHTLLCKHCKGLVGRTDAHRWSEDGHCAICGCEGAVRPVSFLDPRCATDGEIALVFCVEGPFDCTDDHSFDDARVEVAIGGRNARTVTIEAMGAEVDAHGRRLFRVPLSAVEMAEPVTATFVYCDGNEKLVQTTSLEKCISRDAENAVRRKEARCLRSIANMGHYTQGYLADANGWAVGKDYAKIGLRYDKDLAGLDCREALAQHAAKVSVGDSAVASVNMSTIFGSTTTMDVRLTTKAGAKLDAKATFGGEEVTLTRSADGCYHARVEGIRAQDLDKCLRIEGDCDGAFSMDLSVLSYASSAYGAKGASDATKQAMAAVLQYHEAAVDWAASR